MESDKKFIDGSWYEQEYTSGLYKKMYIDREHPAWARESDLMGVDFIRMVLGLCGNEKILDLGSGVGNIINVWNKRGFLNTFGIEISRAAIEHAKVPSICLGTVQNMPFKDEEFDLVTSFAFFEHISQDIMWDSLKEMVRIGKSQAHFLVTDLGKDDISHINKNSPVEWCRCMAMVSPKHVVFILPNPILLDAPLLISIKEENMIYPLKKALSENIKMEKVEMVEGLKDD